MTTTTTTASELVDSRRTLVGVLLSVVVWVSVCETCVVLCCVVLCCCCLPASG